MLLTQERAFAIQDPSSQEISYSAHRLNDAVHNWWLDLRQTLDLSSKALAKICLSDEFRTVRMWSDNWDPHKDFIIYGDMSKVDTGRQLTVTLAAAENSCMVPSHISVETEYTNPDKLHQFAYRMPVTDGVKVSTSVFDRLGRIIQFCQTEPGGELFEVGQSYVVNPDLKRHAPQSSRLFLEYFGSKVNVWREYLSFWNDPEGVCYEFSHAQTVIRSPQRRMDNHRSSKIKSDSSTQFVYTHNGQECAFPEISNPVGRLLNLADTLELVYMEPVGYLNDL